MRTKQSLDRQTQELQENAWIYMLHNRAPPPSRQATLPDAHAPSGFIPLAPLASHAPSPLGPARAAAASLALHVHSAPHAPHLPASSSSSSSSSSWPTPPARAAAPPFGGMVKLEKPKPGPASFVFRSIISKPSVPEAPTPSAHVQRSPGALMAVVTKRPRHDSFAQDKDDEDDDESGDEAVGRTNGSKRACLPKKCDFPMCKNSSRSRGFCYSHGGGRRCRVDGCANGAVSRDLCKRHGGGRRCRIAGCKSSSESGGLCYSHGGGRRCNLSWCNARAKKGGYCAAHVDNRNALPPVDVVEAEREETDKDSSAKAPVKIAAKPAVADAVNPQVVETLLLLSKSPSQSEIEDNSDASSTPSADLMSPRLANPYAIASILN